RGGQEAHRALLVWTGSRASGTGTGRRRRQGRDGADEPEAAPVHCVDVARRAGGVAERLPQVANAGRQGGVAHDRVAPDRREQVLLRDQAVRMPDQVAQDRKRTRRQPQAVLAAPRPFGLRLDANGGKVSGSSRAHATARLFIRGARCLRARSCSGPRRRPSTNPRAAADEKRRPRTATRAVYRRPRAPTTQEIAMTSTFAATSLIPFTLRGLRPAARPWR